MSITHDSKFTFDCDVDYGHPKLVVEAKTERTAIAKVRAKGWDVLRVRAISGVPKNKFARTVQFVCCPGCAARVGVRFR
jgi:hypothetical protein